MLVLFQKLSAEGSEGWRPEACGFLRRAAVIAHLNSA